MNDYVGEIRRRSRSLIIVEGRHEKNKLFWLIFKCFPEIDIEIDDVWIYGTNIYLLYEDIVKEYGIEWAEDGEDIDLPFVISKKHCPDSLSYKKDFKNIILVFDYERHDTNFSERKIEQMQKCFDDVADMGKLYINYPMIESYLHLKALPDYEYAERKIPVTLHPGKKYKALVEKETIIGNVAGFPHKIDAALQKYYGVNEEQLIIECRNAVLDSVNINDMTDKLQEILHDALTEDSCKTLRYQVEDWVKKQRYIHTGQNFWNHMRNVLKQIIYHNICKANRIQNKRYHIEGDRYRSCFEELDMAEILKEQNILGQDSDTGYIWVLNTCVFFVAEYNFDLIEV